MMVVEVMKMYITKEEFEQALANPRKVTPEEKKRMEEIGEKMKKLSPQEIREIRKKLDEEDGFC